MSGQAGAFARANAFMSMTSPLATDALIPIALSGEEAIGEPFHFTVQVVSQTASIDPDTLLDKPVCVALHRDGHPQRWFHGIVQRLTWGGPASRDFTQYAIEMVPSLWFLGQTRNSRIYQSLSAKDILTSMLSDAGITDFRFSLTGTPTAREYTVQYDETNLNFFQRLAQAEGYFTWFEHTATAHTLVVADSNTAFTAIPQPTVTYVPEGGQALNTLTKWSPSTATAFGTIGLADYSAEAPAQSLLKSTATKLGASGASARKIYGFPAFTRSGDDVQAITRRRMEAAEVEASLVTGVGSHEGFAPGGKFSLTNDLGVDSGSTTDYVLRRVVHSASDDTWRSGSGATDYSNSFSAFAASLPWRDPPTAPRPRMDGFYSAVVLGPSGEEIYADKLARILVQFNWATQSGAASINAVSAYYPPSGATVPSNTGTAWVRVIQPWAGNSWGWQHLPRVGTEVAVAFMNGDVDWPVVVGGLYNASNMPIFPLPDQNTKTGLRTRSSPNGSTDNFSEFSIDDKMGSELVYLHAEMDHTVEVEHDESITVGNNRTRDIKVDETIKIGQDQSIKISNDSKLEIGNTQTVKIASGRSVTVTSGGDKLAVQGGDLEMNVAAGSIKGTAATSIELTVGSNSIKITQSGIQIAGMSISIKGSLQVELKGAMVSVGGDAMLTLKGGVMMLN